jgi:hypothetical protein
MFRFNKGKEDTFLSFIFRLKQVISQFADQYVSFDSEYDTKDPSPHIVIEVRNSPFGTHELQLHPKVAKFLGFGDTSIFEGGQTYKSDKRASPELWKQLIKDDEPYPIFLYRIEDKVIEMDEPKETDVDSLVDDIVTVMEKSGFQVDMALGPDNYLIVTPDFSLYQFTFRLPPAINKLIGVDEDFVFSDTEAIYIEPSTTETETPQISTSEKKRAEILKSINSSQLVVECSALEESNFGPYARKVLRIFERKPGIRKSHHFEFNPIEYRRASVDHLNEIRISISNPLFQIIPDTLYPTTVTLHFKPFALL